MAKPAYLFLSNGIMSTLSAILVAENIKKSEQISCLICIERNGHLSEEYYKIIDILLSTTECFEEKFIIESDFYVFNKSKIVESLQLGGYYKFIAHRVKRKLKESDYTITKLLFPSTSRLWPKLIEDKPELHLIEHGLGEYFYLMKYKKHTNLAKSVLNKIWDRIVDYKLINSSTPFSFAWLCTDNFKVTNENLVIEQLDCSDSLNHIIAKFWLKYESEFTKESEEIEKMKKCNLDYIYLPSDEVKFDLYESFIREQMSFLGVSKDKNFLIKNHPADTKTDFARFLQNYGMVNQFAFLQNLYIPSEFLIHKLKVNVIGSCSTTLYYSKAWLKEIRVFIYCDYPDYFVTPENFGIQRKMQLLTKSISI